MWGGDLKQPRWIHVKGWMFLFLGLLASGMLIAESPSWKIMALLAIAVWAFCRFYFYSFSVIEKYVDPTFKYDGWHSFLKYWWQRKNPRD